MTLLDNGPEVTDDSADPELPKWAYLIIVPIVMLLMPIFVCFQHILSAVIIGFGLWQAWKMNRAVPLTISGPYPV
ncbi:MAG: hypothetical protein EBX36_07125 [Planctomycetia bacterium]|nr:hypothetical protein [Planctomycetia bacterium]